MSSAKALLKRPPSRDVATIMFLDIRGFSSLFDQHDPMEVLEFGNTVLSELGMVVEACSGVIDKFTGDGFLAHFGILEKESNHAKNACECAVRIRASVEKLNLKRYLDQQIIVAVGIGISSGLIASGVISTSVKAEFSVFGDVVNLAARIESLTKEFTVDCLVSESVFEACKESLMFKKMPAREVRGFKSIPNTYWLLPTNIFI